MITPETFFGGATAITSAVNITINPLLGRVQRLDFTAASKTAKLPDARTMKGGGPHFLFVNCGANAIDLIDQLGSVVATMATDKAYEVALTDDSIAIGKWYVQEWTVTTGCEDADGRLLYFTGGGSFSYPSGNPSSPLNRTALFRIKTWSFDPSDNAFVQKTNYPETQAMPVAATTGAAGRFFTHGSREQSAGVAGDHKKFVPATNVWTSEAKQPSNNPPRQEFAVEDDGDDKVYHFGGETGGTWLDIFTTWEMKGRTTTWTQRINSIISFRRGVCSRAIGKIYCAGWVPSLQYSLFRDPTLETGYNSAYNPVTDSFSAAGAYTTAGTSEQMSGRGLNKVYAFAGGAGRVFSALAEGTEVQGDGLDGANYLIPPIGAPASTPSLVLKAPRWDKFDPLDDTWSNVKLLPFDLLDDGDFYCQGGRALASGAGPVHAASDTAYIYQFGGTAACNRLDDPGGANQGMYIEGLNDVERYDLILETCSTKTQISEPSFHMGATAI